MLIENYLPDSYQAYLFKNYQMSHTYRSYNAFVPTYLHDRPRAVILHCLERKTKSRKFTVEDVEIIDTTQGVFNVMGTSGVKHTVNFGKSSGTPSCTCKDWCQSNLPCKHFFAIFNFFDNWRWESLPEVYLTSLYMSLDSASFSVTSIPDISSTDTDIQEPEHSHMEEDSSGHDN